MARHFLLEGTSECPNSGPHGLPALMWPGLYKSLLTSDHSPGSRSRVPGYDGVREALRQQGWDPQWTFPMYREAHFHSTTHELLCIVRGSATLQLGGTDGGGGGDDGDGAGVADQSNAPSLAVVVVVDVAIGDVLLLPAGYSHRALQDADGFTMIGSYPSGQVESWDMCYPDRSQLPRASERIKQLVETVARRGLGEYATDPSPGGNPATRSTLEQAWGLA
ncbi:unnamed protein product [Parajaminaea phylloscopi]